MDFLERAAKTSIQKIEQLDRQIKLPSEDRTKSTIPLEEQLYLRTNELLKLREMQKMDFVATTGNHSDTSNTSDSLMRQSQRVDRLNTQISHERALRASLESRTGSTTTGDNNIVEELLHAQKELSIERRKRDERLESLRAIELNRDDAKLKLERLEMQMHEEVGAVSGMKSNNDELEQLRKKIEERRRTLSEQTSSKTKTVVSSIQEVELEASLNAKADELIQAQIAIERYTSEIATLAMRRDAVKTSSSTIYDSSTDPATSTHDLLHLNAQRNIFEHFRMHIAKFIGHRRAGKLIYLFGEIDNGVLRFARTTSNKWRVIGFMYLVVIFSIAFLRTLF